MNDFVTISIDEKPCLFLSSENLQNFWYNFHKLPSKVDCLTILWVVPCI